MKKLATACLPDTFQPSPKANQPSFLMGALSSSYNKSTKAKRRRRRAKRGAGVCSCWEPGHIELVSSSSPDTILFLLGTGLSSPCIPPWQKLRRERKRDCPRALGKAPAPHRSCLAPLSTPSDASWPTLSRIRISSAG